MQVILFHVAWAVLDGREKWMSTASFEEKTMSTASVEEKEMSTASVEEEKMSTARVEERRCQQPAFFVRVALWDVSAMGHFPAAAPEGPKSDSKKAPGDTTTKLH